MKLMLAEFMGPDGKLDRKKIQRLEARQRKVCRGKIGAGDVKGVLRDEAFLFGTYMFDTLSPKKATMGSFKPFLEALGGSWQLLAAHGVS